MNTNKEIKKMVPQKIVSSSSYFYLVVLPLVVLPFFIGASSAFIARAIHGSTPGAFWVFLGCSGIGVLFVGIPLNFIIKGGVLDLTLSRPSSKAKSTDSHQNQNQTP